MMTDKLYELAKQKSQAFKDWRSKANTKLNEFNPSGYFSQLTELDKGHFNK